MVRKVVVMIGVYLLLASCDQSSRSYDFTKPEDALDAYLRIRLSADEDEEVVFHWRGTVYQFVTGQATRPLFNMEGYSIGRAKKTDEGYDQLTREIMVFKDLETDSILKTWYNPDLDETVEVHQVANDPVNFHLQAEALTSDASPLKFEQLNADQYAMSADIWLLYPSPLTLEAFPENTRSDQYQRGEIFQFFFHKGLLEHNRSNSIPVTFSWTSIGDYMPWMRMGQRPGYLVYTGRGAKLSEGFEGLPSTLKHYILRSRPKYAHAPETFSGPNMTSWKTWKAEMEERAATAPQ